MNNLQEILVKPILSEKATDLSERRGQVTFRVLKEASKGHIRQAVESVYGVKVLKVRTCITKGKVKRRGQSSGRRPNTKKAMVQLAEGQTIDFFAAE